jgi:hypothetical protein
MTVVRLAEPSTIIAFFELICIMTVDSIAGVVDMGGVRTVLIVESIDGRLWECST